MPGQSTVARRVSVRSLCCVAFCLIAMPQAHYLDSVSLKLGNPYKNAARGSDDRSAALTCGKEELQPLHHMQLPLRRAPDAGHLDPALASVLVPIWLV